MNKEVIIMVGSQGSGKTTMSRDLVKRYVDYGALRISQDDMGKREHWKEYLAALEDSVSYVIVDRINHTREMRKKYIDEAKKYGYVTTIIDLTSSPRTCFSNIKKRKAHPTLPADNPMQVLRALYHYYKNYEKPLLQEADNVNDLTTFNPYCLDLTDKFYDPVNKTYKRHFVVGDVHGCFDELMDILSKANVDNIPIISVGDLVDRGPKIFETLKYFMNHETYVCRGNHEDKLLRYIIGNNVTVSKGLQETLSQWEKGWNKSILKTDLALYLMSMPLMIKIGSNFFFHAGIDPTKRMEQQSGKFLLMGRKYNPDDGTFEDREGSKYWHEYIDSEKMPHFRYSRRFFGHQYHPAVMVAYNTYALDGHCVHGKEMRGVLLPDRTVFKTKARKVYWPEKDGKVKITGDPSDKLAPFENHVKDGYLRKVEKGDMVLYTYTDKCTYEKHWNIITKQARGIIFNKKTGQCLARPFPKFFNLGEVKETMYAHLPKEPYECFEKIDGSLGIVFHDGKKWTVATKGSFDSPQALKAQQMLKKYNLNRIPKSWTMLVEIVYPENRRSPGAYLVCDYGASEFLVLLGIINRDTRHDMGANMVSRTAKYTKMEPVEYYPDTTIEEIIEDRTIIPSTREGWVVKYQSGLRVKIKGEEYLKHHRAISNITPLFFWENMVKGKVDPDILEKIPEECRDEAEALAGRLENKYQTYYGSVLMDMDKMLKDKSIKKDEGPDVFRKSVGLYIKNTRPEHGAAFFPIIDDEFHAVDKYVLRRIRPTGNIL